MAVSASPLGQFPRGAVITLDTAPIIYFLQDHPIVAPLFAPVFEAADRGDLSIVISAVTLAEVLTGPLQAKNEMLAARYRETLTRSPGWELWPVDEEVAATAARFRAEYKLRTPDAILVATAIASRSHALVTHDRRLRKISGILVLVPEEPR
jgi:predicted nucleic acid-binding protein